MTQGLTDGGMRLTLEGQTSLSYRPSIFELVKPLIIPVLRRMSLQTWLTMSGQQSAKLSKIRAVTMHEIDDSGDAWQPIDELVHYRTADPTTVKYLLRALITQSFRSETALQVPPWFAQVEV